MKLKLPPKLLSPYTLAEWLDLGYDKDPKFTKTLKFLNLALINLKRTKPPTAEAFEEFTTHTAYLIKRLKKMLGDSEMPDNVREEFCEPFYQLLRKWQKGAVKVQDILEEEGAEQTAGAADAAKSMLKTTAQAGACFKDYATLAKVLDKALKDAAQLNAFVAKGITAPKLDAAVEQLRSKKLLKSLQAAGKKCSGTRDKLPALKELDQQRAEAKEKNNNALATQIAAAAKQIDNIDKLARNIDAGMANYEKSIDAIIKQFDARIAA